jgi:hypothetical protein
VTTRDELLATLERERVRDYDALPQERYRPGGVERVAGIHPAYTPISEDRATRNRAELADALGIRDTYTPTEKGEAA